MANCTPDDNWFEGWSRDLDGVVTPYGYSLIAGYYSPTAFLGAGCRTAGVGTITPAQLGGNNNPLTAVELVEVGTNAGQITLGNSLPFDLIGPYQVVVEGDEWAYYCTSCNTNNIRRLTTYKVINSDGSPAANIPTGEILQIGGWNCTQPVPVTEADSCTTATGTVVLGVKSLGMSATGTGGAFTDSWTLGGHNYTPGGCGFKALQDQWQLCGLAQVTDAVENQFDSNVNWGLTFAGLNGAVFSEEVDMTINGQSYNIGPGNCAVLSEYPLCPYAVPKGTIITPNN